MPTPTDGTREEVPTDLPRGVVLEIETPKERLTSRSEGVTIDADMTVFRSGHTLIVTTIRMDDYPCVPRENPYTYNLTSQPDQTIPSNKPTEGIRNTLG